VTELERLRCATGPPGSTLRPCNGCLPGPSGLDPFTRLAAAFLLHYPARPAPRTPLTCGCSPVVRRPQAASPPRPSPPPRRLGRTPPDHPDPHRPPRQPRDPGPAAVDPRRLLPARSQPRRPRPLPRRRPSPTPGGHRIRHLRPHHTGRYTPQAYARRLRRLAHTAGIDGADRVHPHSLRHSFATRALDLGVPLQDVQDALGRADPRATRRYDRNHLTRSPGYLIARDFSPPNPSPAERRIRCQSTNWEMDTTAPLPPLPRSAAGSSWRIW